MTGETTAGKLPVLAIFIEAVKLPGIHLGTLIRFASPYFAVLAIAAVTGFVWPFVPDEPGELSSLSVLLVIPMLFAAIMAVVGVHRTYLMTRNEVAATRTFRFTRRELNFAGWWIGLGLLAALMMFPLFMVIMPLLAAGLADNAENPVIIVVVMLFYIPVAYMLSRWSLVLPATAIDAPEHSLGWSWKLSQGNGWRLTLLIAVLPALTDICLEMLPAPDSLLYSVSISGIWLIVIAIEIGLLSLSYAWFMQTNAASTTG